MSEEKLIPPDYDRCQCEIHKRLGVFQLGGRPLTITQCDRVPEWLAWAPDGPGRMTLCNPHKLICEKQVPGSEFRCIRPWGVATMSEGIRSVHRTRAEAVRALGFATPWKRKRIGKPRYLVYYYVTEGGAEGYVGRIADLEAQGFTRQESTP